MIDMFRHKARFQDAAAFYTTMIGERTRLLLGRSLASIKSSRVFGNCLLIGYGLPYADLLPERTFMARPAHPQTVRRPPHATISRDCLIDTSRLPIGDFSMNTIIMIHGLEFAASAPELLRASWKALEDSGRLIIIVPNRSGLWTRSDRTPLGYGTPFSNHQIRQLLEHNLFTIERTLSALWMPPFLLQWFSGRFLEELGRFLPSSCAGAHLLVARKNLYAGLPVVATREVGLQRRRVISAIWNRQKSSLP